MTTPPEWELDAVQTLVMDAVAGQLMAEQDATQARKHTLDALDRFFTTINENAPGDTDRILYVALHTACLTAYKAAPPGTFGDGDGPVTLVMEDSRTGEVIPDPDDEIADNPDGDPHYARGALAAMRFFTAVANDDTATSVALFDAMATAQPDDSDQHIASTAFLMLVIEYAASVLAHVAREHKTALDTLDRSDAVDAITTPPAPPTPEAAPDIRHDPVTGLDFVTIKTDDRDNHPDDRDRLAMPHGPGRYGLTIYRLGDPAGRDKVATAALAAITSAATTAHETLCGADHTEDVELHQILHTARPHARRALRQAARQHGGHWQLLRVWQHHGACPDHTRDPGPDDVPLFDLGETA